jgi:nucleoside phosphorylase
VDKAILEAAAAISQDADLDSCTPDSVFLEHHPETVTGGNNTRDSFFVDNPAYRRWTWDTYQGNAIDMETSAVTRVAHARNVPFIAFRSPSDPARGGRGANEIDTSFQLAASEADTAPDALTTPTRLSHASIPRHTGLDNPKGVTLPLPSPNRGSASGLTVVGKI